jgi:hypothetical protein
MEAVDGNAIGGLLYEVFSTEMTGAARPLSVPIMRRSCD